MILCLSFDLGPLELHLLAFLVQPLVHMFHTFNLRL
jgi:hypothetical protein